MIGGEKIIENKVRDTAAVVKTPLKRENSYLQESSSVRGAGIQTQTMLPCPWYSDNGRVDDVCQLFVTRSQRIAIYYCGFFIDYLVHCYHG